LQKELLGYACVVHSALASGASKEQMCVLKSAKHANLKGVSEQVCQMLEEAAHMADLHGKFCLVP